MKPSSGDAMIRRVPSRRGGGKRPGAFARMAGLPADERGSIGLTSVFATLILTALLGMILHVGRHVDRKMRTQNAADAAAHSGGVTLARGMNAVAFSNHLLCDVFALTAFMREGASRDGEMITPDILAAWDKSARSFEKSGWERFERMGRAMREKIPLEAELIAAYGEWAYAASQTMSPVLERILAEELIPDFQRAVVFAAPRLAQAATADLARQHGLAQRAPEIFDGFLWRTSADTIGADFGYPESRVLPAIDPTLDAMPNRVDYFRRATDDRRHYVFRYLKHWNDDAMRPFDVEAKLSRFADLWRGFTAGKLEELLLQYPDRNLPFMIRTERDDMTDVQRLLEREFLFVATVHARPLSRTGASVPGTGDQADSSPRLGASGELSRGEGASPDPAPSPFARLFRVPGKSHPLAFAQVMLFVPRPRLIWMTGSDAPPEPGLVGGIAGDIGNLEGPAPPPPNRPIQTWRFVGRQSHPTEWSLWNQNWMSQIVPATTENLAKILIQWTPGHIPPDFGGATSRELRSINTH